MISRNLSIRLSIPYKPAKSDLKSSVKQESHQQKAGKTDVAKKTFLSFL